MDKTKILSKISNLQILVVGDVILDKYLNGNVNRISPEAPVPVVNLDEEFHRLGGAANVAKNIADVGAKCTLVGKAGNDKNYELLVRLIEDTGIDHKIVIGENFRTITKTRILSNGQQIVRVDDEYHQNTSPKELKEIEAFLRVRNFDVIILSDYNKGLFNDKLIDIVRGKDIPIVVDPKPQNIGLFKNAHSITPNHHEANKLFPNHQIDEIGVKLKKDLNANVIITMGKDGVVLFEKDNEKVSALQTVAQEVVDVSGAGDTFVAIYSLLISLNINLKEALEVANRVCGMVVKKSGTASITREELEASLNGVVNTISSKLLKKEQIRYLDFGEKEKIVFTNGCFDILHEGHITLLEKAKRFGEKLIVGLNSDASIKKIKGDNRPINSESSRIKLLSSIIYIDYIILFDDETPIDLIKSIRPDILVKGGDYSEPQIVGADFIKSYGGQVKIIDLVEGKSTTNIINKLDE